MTLNEAEQELAKMWRDGFIVWLGSDPVRGNKFRARAACTSEEIRKSDAELVRREGAPSRDWKLN
jgi:hypothetical protein